MEDSDEHLIYDASVLRVLTCAIHFDDQFTLCFDLFDSLWWNM